MLPPLLAGIRRALMGMPLPRSDEQDALLAELQALDTGAPASHPGVGAPRSIGGVINSCPVCLRPFGDA